MLRLTPYSDALQQLETQFEFLRYTFDKRQKERTKEFFERYAGKRVVFGHTGADSLPQQLSTYTPADGGDLFYRGCVVGIDTGCGHGGFLTAIELPSLKVYESRRAKIG